MKAIRFYRLLSCLLFCGNVFSQGSYFKVIEQPFTSLFQRIGQFPDGSVLVGDKLQDGPTSMVKRGFYLAKFDPCGEKEWAKYYNPSAQLLFDDIEIGSDGSVFIMGTKIENSFETLFLLKLNEAGEVLNYHYFPGTWNEMFTYSLDLNGSEIMVSGLLFYPASEKQGFVAKFDLNLGLIWCKQFEPFNAYGESILTNHGGALTLSGSQLIKLGPSGQLEWAEQLGQQPINDFGTPLESDDGFLFHTQEDSFSQIILLDKNGALGWQSEKFIGRQTVDGLSLLPSGDQLLIYDCPSPNGNIPCQLRVSPIGEIFGQRRLQIDFPLWSNFMFHELGPDGNINLFGRAGAASSDPISYADFLTRFPLDGPTGDCFTWENFDATAINDFELPITPITVTITDAPMVSSEQLLFTPQEIALVENEICPLSSNTVVTKTDTLLACDQNWHITLPDSNLIWEDGSAQIQRILFEPGSYRASKVICRDTTVFEYVLEKTDCECSVFLPNAISPNGDGFNDELQIFSNCTLREIQLDIYNRWGGRVFRSDGLDLFWDGTFDGHPIQAGVYLILVRYQLEDELGVVRERMEIQDLTVIR